MKPFVLPLVLGLFLGFAAGVLWDFEDPPDSADRPVKTAESEPPVARDATDDRTQRILDLEARNARLVAELDSLKQGPPSGGVNWTTGKVVDAQDIADQMRPHLRRMVDRELLKYQGRLNLTREQRQRLQDILVLKQERNHASMMRRFNPQAADDETVEAISNEDVRALAREFLSDEQLDEYADIQREERQARNEMIATARLGQVAPMLGLSDEQKDAVYSLFYAAAEGMEEDFAPMPDPESREQVEQSLSEILTAEQLKQYQEFRDAEQGGEMVFSREG